jgi:hypothetical protein
MNIADELQKLAKLRQEGSLTDEEFAEAKRRLLAQEAEEEAAEPVTSEEKSAASMDAAGEMRFQSSRWSTGNTFFPDSLTISGDGILFRKGRMFGSSEERINYKAIASLRAKNGIFLSSISVETSGGSQPIFINGLWKSDAKKIQDLIREFQRLA